MKKLLTILTLALALCLVCGAALADEPYYQGYTSTLKTVSGGPDYYEIVADAQVTLDGKNFPVQGVALYGETTPKANINVYQTTEKPCDENLVNFSLIYTGKDSLPYFLTYTVKFDHEWKSTAILKAPTCAEEGLEEFTCVICGKVKTEKIAKLPHDTVQVVTVPATCTEDGKAVDKCKNCDYTSDEYVLNAGGHDWQLKKIKPHCNEDKSITAGWVYPYCTKCGAFVTYADWDAAPLDTNGKKILNPAQITASADKTHNKIVDPYDWWVLTGEDIEVHDWTGWHYIDWTCNSKGYKIRYCNVCKENEIKDLEWDDPAPYCFRGTDCAEPAWEVVYNNAQGLTCAARYGKTKDVYIRCSRCEGKVPGHSLNTPFTPYTWTNPYDASTMTFSVNIGVNPAEVALEYQPVVYTITGGGWPTTIAVLRSHVYDFTTAYLKDTVKPTCTVDGYKEYYCVNGKTHHTYKLYTDALKATGHKMGAWIVQEKPEGTVPGRWIRYCQNPGCTYWEEQKGFFSDHPCDVHKGKMVTIKAATCTENGIERMQCEVCLDWLGEEKVIKATGHDFEDYKTVTAPTCTKAGEMLQVCKNCDVTQIVAVEALGHDIVKDEAVAPTCNDTGLTEGEHCSRCDYVKEQEVVPATGIHNFEGSEIAVTKPATCTEAGEGVVTCVDCKVAVKKVEIPATGHELEDEEGKEATCEEAGYTAYKVCAKCGYEEGKEVIPALGHDLQKVPAVAATCTEDGATEGYGCTRCDYVVVAPTVLPALGHDIVKDAAVAATCTEDGLTEGEHCTRCDYKVEQEVVEALGHDFGEYTVTKEATPFEAGEKVAVCSRCGEEDKVEFEFVPEKDPAYTVEAIHDGEYVTGAVEHDPWTKEADKLFVRVTLFLADGTTSISVSVVNEDGTFEVGATGNIVHIEIALTGTAKAVKPGYSYFGGCDL